MLGTQARLILIDDDRVDYVITQKLLAQLDTRHYELDWADGYEEGLRALERRNHDLCLLDYRLGDRDGLDLLRTAAREGCGIPTILLTEYGDDDLDRRALALGASGFLDKSRLEPRDLDRAVRYALKREGMVSELLEQNSELLLLHKLTRALLGKSPDFDAAASEIATSTGFPMVMIELLRESSQTLYGLAAHGVPRAAGREVPLDASPASEVVRTGRPRIEMSLDGENAAPGLWIRSFACLPMIVADKTVGVLTLAHPYALPIDAAAVNRAAAVAEHVGELIAHVELV